MNVLWLCNVMLPFVAEQMNIEKSNKEGWLTGLVSVVMKNKALNGIELSLAFPVPQSMVVDGHNVCKRVFRAFDGEVPCYGFLEDTTKAEEYDERLEESLSKIIADCEPDVIHCFGTEYPHTLAACRVAPDKSKLLIGIQGLCSVCADVYFSGLPEKVINSVTFRDRLRKDSIIEQKEKFEKRGKMEVRSLQLAGNITGRTEWDRFYARTWNPDARYFNMNETLRSDFYDCVWKEEDCIPHTIFVTQGDYPIKGLHFLFMAMPLILKKYPDTKVYVAGNSIVNYKTLKQKIKISSYGKYLRKIMKKNGISDKVVFLGRLTGTQMKERYLKSHLYLCCSTIENSPNSLGEAMLLGMPCVASDVGGIPSIFSREEDGILYKGYRSKKSRFYQDETATEPEVQQAEKIAKRIAKSVISMWDDREKMQEYCKNARYHALKTHNGERNYQKLVEIYTKIVMGGKE